MAIKISVMLHNKWLQLIHVKQMVHERLFIWDCSKWLYYRTVSGCSVYTDLHKYVLYWRAYALVTGRVCSQCGLEMTKEAMNLLIHALLHHIPVHVHVRRWHGSAGLSFLAWTEHGDLKYS